MWDQTLRLWASTSLSESEPTDSHTRSRGAYLHLGAPGVAHPPCGVGVLKKPHPRSDIENPGVVKLVSST